MGERSFVMSKIGGVFRATPVRRIFAKHDAWRNHPLVAENFTFDTLAPGFVNAAGIFGVYVFLDQLSGSMSKGGHKTPEQITQGKIGKIEMEILLTEKELRVADAANQKLQSQGQEKLDELNKRKERLE